MISNTLQRLGLDTGLDGFNYLVTAIELHTDWGLSTMELYAEVARLYHTTVKCVEHASRYAVREGWLHRDASTAYAVFGNNEDIPTTGKFIKQVSKYYKHKGD